MKITKRQLRSLIREELKKGPYGYDGADQATYDDAYQQIMDVVAELGYTSPGVSEPDPKVQGAIYNALTEIAKELETEMKMAREQGPRR